MASAAAAPTSSSAESGAAGAGAAGAAGAEPDAPEAPKLIVAAIGGTFSLSRDSLFVFTPGYAGSGLTVSDDLCTVQSSSGGQALVLGSKGFLRGVHYWEVKVLAGAAPGNVFIGKPPPSSVVCKRTDLVIR